MLFTGPLKTAISCNVIIACYICLQSFYQLNTFENLTLDFSHDRTYGPDNLRGTDSHDGPLPDISTSTSSADASQQQQQQPPRRTRSHTPSGKRKQRSNQQSDSDTQTWVRPTTTATPTSVSTGDTVIPRRLPPAPPQQSSNSTSTDKSLPRSMPYYEVPASRMPYTPGRMTSVPIIAPPGVPSPSSQQQHSSYQNGDAFAAPPERNTGYMYGREERSYTQIDRSKLI